eukprot:scaffold97823_cov66-Phaeocystis_antarctica.AAC.2
MRCGLCQGTHCQTMNSAAPLARMRSRQTTPILNNVKQFTRPVRARASGPASSPTPRTTRRNK